MISDEDIKLLNKIKKHPSVRKRVEEILNIAENTSGELITARQAEEKAIEEIRKLGQEVLKDWAKNQHDNAVEKEYLSDAANHSWSSEKERWLKEKQTLLKENRHEEVLKSIRVRLPIEWDPKQTEEEGTAVEKCYKYIFNRQSCLDYKGALEKGLPIGSGEVESGHRYIIQKRLKISGAWWRPSTANHMLALRSLRANEDWSAYWQWQQLAA